jgi:hypothetical protein
MSKPLTLVAALLLLAGCNASNPVAPATSEEPSFAHRTNGCPTATTNTTGTAGGAHVIAACTTRGE